MAVPTPNQYWIRPDALTITLNTPDVDYLRATVLAGSAIIAYMKGVIDYDPSHNYRKWTIQAADTFLETTGEYYVHAQLTRSESPATALIVYSLTKRSITGKTVEADGTETGEEDKDHFYIYLGKISASIDKDGQKVGRTWLEEYNPGKLDTNQGRTEDMEGHYLSRLFNDTAQGLITFEQGIALPFKTTGETEGDVENNLQDIDSVVTSDNVSQSELFTDNAVMTAATFAKLFKVKKDPKTGKEYIHTAYSLASEGAISTKGVGISEDDGQLAYVRLDEWPEKWDESLNGYVLSAGLGHGLKERIEKLEEVDEDSDKTYVHTQGTASNIWTIVHNLNKYPSVTVVDSAHTVVIGEVRYDSLDQVTVLFAATFSGMATLN